MALCHAVFICVKSKEAAKTLFSINDGHGTMTEIKHSIRGEHNV